MGCKNELEYTHTHPHTHTKRPWLQVIYVTYIYSTVETNSHIEMITLFQIKT